MKTPGLLPEANPIKKFREGLGETQKEFAAKGGFHENTLVRLEQGCYADIPPRIRTYLNQRGYPSGSLTSDYRVWIRLRRVASYGLLPEQLPPAEVPGNPFVAWRVSGKLSRLDVCKLFAVHTSTITRLETKKVTKLPEQLEDALIQSGYPVGLVAELGRRLQNYVKGLDDDRLSRAAV